MKINSRWRWLGIGLLVGMLLAFFLTNALVRGTFGGFAGVFRRNSQILYLAPANAPELWRAEADGTAARQLTHSGGKVYDMAAWQDGSAIVYSLGNSLGGLNLWMMDREGQAASQLLDCGADRCAQPAVSPDGHHIAYSRRNQGENPGGSAGQSRIWLYTLKTRETSPLYANAMVTGAAPVWAPDGLSLAFYNPRAAAIQVFPVSGGKDVQIPTQLEGVGGFLPDSLGMIFGSYVQGEERPFGVLSKFDFVAGHTQSIFTDLGFVDYGAPAVNTSGDWLAVAGRLEGEATARHIWLLKLDGTEKLRVSEDAQLSQAAYRWDASGKRLLYQQLRLGQSDQTPEVYWWGLDQRTPHLVAKDAFLPVWLP